MNHGFKLHPDGTLEITMPKGVKVGRVLVKEEGTQDGALYCSKDVPDTNVGDINKFIDGLEEIFADLRERHVDDSVCGLCEYDGAYLGQSGDWCNECPGFEKDDCFKLSGKIRKEWTDEIIKALPSAEPERWDTCFDCPLSHGCPVINGCTNEQAMQYAGEIPDDCPVNKISAEPEWKKGNWIKNIERFGDNAYHCSQCGAVLEKDDLEWRNNYYCYHCGSKMER